MTNPSKANQRFEISALALGIELEIVSFPHETRTAKQAAHALQCELGQIVKSLVFECDGSAVLALTAGDHQVDTQRLGVLLGGSVGKADAKLVKEATGFSIGGVPPFGHVTQLQCFIDHNIFRYQTAWGAAGTPDTVFSLQTKRLPELSGGQVEDFVCIR